LEFAKACNCIRENTRGTLLTIRSQPKHHPPENRNNSEKNEDCRCKSCRVIDAGNHPDILPIGPIGAFVKIGQIRDLSHTLSMKPYQAQWRVVIVSKAHTMNPAAGNALLKMLEEPPDRTLIILMTSQRAKLLPTVVSRCQHIRFKPIPTERIIAYLTDDLGVESEQAAIIAAMSNGSFSLAAEKAKGNWISRRNLIIKEIVSISDKPVTSILAFAEKLAHDKTALIESLDIIQSWLRDILIFNHAPDRIIHKDLTERIQYASEGSDPAKLLKKMKVMEKTQQVLQTNANARLAMESALLELAKQ